ncbi:unnamed protein product [Acanthoscelides obtectus]|uniref:TGF-beta family profile domain-containing protein n=1 Tax=Acanthoscelides obtectus TaxID=200917 RepID=A0A9P0K9Z0_ACAOB|nr:unnamed protein product [Acanthoscelides obtectus]CAK1660868.1 Bone morphogenetic protein 5 [Acanthoscelides obtectus]
MYNYNICNEIGACFATRLTAKTKRIVDHVLVEQGYNKKCSVLVEENPLSYHCKLPIVLKEERKVYNEKTIISNQYLDAEWDFDHSIITKTELPVFIEKFHEEQARDIVNSPNMKFLFNTQWNTTSPIIKFNLNTLRERESMLEAQLYIYWPVSNDSRIYKQSAVLRLYQIENIKEASNETELLQNPDVHKLSNVIYVSKALKGWQTFKITKAINNWLNGESNMGLLLTTSLYEGNELIEIFNDTNNGIYSTFVAISLEDQDSSRNTITLSQHNQAEAACRKTTWNVSLKQLGWDNFIITPSNFQASDCSGNCAQVDITAINYVKLLQITKKRRSYCVPSGYTFLPIMYYDRYNNVVLKKYKNIIATSCGCR